MREMVISRLFVCVQWILKVAALQWSKRARTRRRWWYSLWCVTFFNLGLDL